jgi:hypothetical protein
MRIHKLIYICVYFKHYIFKSTFIFTYTIFSGNFTNAGITTHCCCKIHSKTNALHQMNYINITAPDSTGTGNPILQGRYEICERGGRGRGSEKVTPIMRHGHEYMLCLVLD